MRVAIDATPILLSRGGVGRFVKYLIQTIIEIDRDDQFVLFFGTFKKYEYFKLCKPNVTIIRSPLPAWVVQRMDIYCPLPIETFVGEVDMAHGTAYSINTKHTTRSIISVYDLAYKNVSNIFPKSILREMDVRLKDNLVKATLILTSSECTKKDLMKYFKVDHEKIWVVPGGIAKIFSTKHDIEVSNTIKHRLNIQREFILHVGSFEPRKNLERLLIAYNLLRENKSIDHQLVMVGKDGWLNANFFENIKKSKYSKDIIILKKISEDELIALYNTADLLVYPSLYEGFGFPLVEAMACGTPIAASNSSCIPEVAGEAAIYFDPYAVEEMVDKIAELVFSQSLKDNLTSKGLQRARTFTWEKAAKKTIEAYRYVYSSKESSIY